MGKDSEYYVAGKQLAEESINNKIYRNFDEFKVFSEKFGPQPLYTKVDAEYLKWYTNWGDFLRGCRDTWREYKYEKFKDIVNDFRNSLLNFLNDYPNVSLYADEYDDCGGGGGVIFKIEDDFISLTLPIKDDWKNYFN